MGDQRDPENRFYWRKPVQRLDAEVIRDSILATSGALNKGMFGPPVPVRPDLHGQIVVDGGAKPVARSTTVNPAPQPKIRWSLWIPLGAISTGTPPARPSNSPGG